MAADLHIHIFEGITEEDMKFFFSNTIGSKYFNCPDKESEWNDMKDDKYDQTYEKMAKTPNIWIGEVSWLKAILFEDSEHFVPSTVGEIQDIIGEDLPVINDELIKNILDTFNLENKTMYSLANKEDVEKFLIKNKGKKIFTVSW